MQKITPFLWFDSQAEEEVNFYVAIFKNSKILKVTRYSDPVAQAAGRPKGSVMTVAFELEGEKFTAINGGPQFKFTEAVSFVVSCDSQAELDNYWNKLSKGGDEKAQQCGWLKDKYGLSWQVFPTVLPEMLKDHESQQAQRVMNALLRMKKIDIAELERAFAGRENYAAVGK